MSNGSLHPARSVSLNTRGSVHGASTVSSSEIPESSACEPAGADFVTGIDGVLLLTLYFGMCASNLIAEVEGLCSLIPHTLLFVYEIVTGTSPAKQALGLTVAFDVPRFRYRVYRALPKYWLIPFLVYPSMVFTKRQQGLHDVAAKAIVARTANRGLWLRAILATFLSGYLMLTFGCGRMFTLMMADRYDPYLASLEPEPWMPESPVPSDWMTRWQRGGRVNLPTAIDGLRLRPTPFLQVYGPPGRRRTGPGVVVMLTADSHPYVEYCKDPHPALRWSLPCEVSPRAAQKALFEAVGEDTVYLDPRAMIGENAKRLGKTSLLEGDELLTFRSYDGPELSVIWYALAQYDDDDELRIVIDYINVAGDSPDDHYVITVFWSGVARAKRPSSARSLRHFDSMPATRSSQAAFFVQGGAPAPPWIS